MTDLENDSGSRDDKIISQAKKRFKTCQEWESEYRQRYKADLKFANGDPDNRWQWPDEIYSSRQAEMRPCLTVNRTRQHNLQIINDAKQNKPGVVIRPNGGDASYDAAQVFEGVIRHIEYISAAEQAYDTATSFQVQVGIGYVRLETDYLHDGTFDQEIYIRRVKDPLSVYLDPSIVQVDGSDARFGFVFEDVPLDVFEEQYGEADKAAPVSFSGSDDWSGKDRVRVCEYFRVVEKADKLVSYMHEETGERTAARRSKVGKEVFDALAGDIDATKRDITERSVEWFKIAGDKIIERGTWPGKYIPIARCVGEETVIEGRLDRKGHTRNSKDSQRMYNYWTSSAVEHVALQTKTPWVASIESIEGFEAFYEGANKQNLAYLPYNAFDDQGRPLAKPERVAPPQMAAAYIDGMKVAQQEMMMATGQYQSQMGEAENAKSGVAINARQRQGDNATYHYVDGLAIMIRHIGRMLLDLVPKIYDTERIVHIIGDDNKKREVRVDPQAKEAYSEGDPSKDTVAAIFNPNVGYYDVQADIGPAYATRRQEAFNAFTQIISQNEALTPIVGDIMFKNADFPGADELAERLERMVPAQAKGGDADPQVMQMQEAVKNAQSMIQKLIEQIAEKDREIRVKENDSETKRITAVANAIPQLGPEALMPLIQQMISEAMGAGFTNEPQQAAPPQGEQMTNLPEGDATVQPV